MARAGVARRRRRPGIGIRRRARRPPRGAEAAPWNVPVLLRPVGAAGRNAMRADEQARIVDAVRRMLNVFFRCSPALWGALAARRPAAGDGIPKVAIAHWRTEDAAKDSVRAPRLRVGRDARTDDKRTTLATDLPLAASTDDAAASRIGAAMLRRPTADEPGWRAFAPTDADPSETWAAPRGIMVMKRTTRRTEEP